MKGNFMNNATRFPKEVIHQALFKKSTHSPIELKNKYPASSVHSAGLLHGPWHMAHLALHVACLWRQNHVTSSMDSPQPALDVDPARNPDLDLHWVYVVSSLYTSLAPSSLSLSPSVSVAAPLLYSLNGLC